LFYEFSLEGHELLLAATVQNLRRWPSCIEAFPIGAAHHRAGAFAAAEAAYRRALLVIRLRPPEIDHPAPLGRPIGRQGAGDGGSIQAVHGEEDVPARRERRRPEQHPGAGDGDECD
jgi:hypothetical protein